MLVSPDHIIRLSAKDGSVIAQTDVSVDDWKHFDVTVDEEHCFGLSEKGQVWLGDSQLQRFGLLTEDEAETYDDVAMS